MTPVVDASITHNLDCTGSTWDTARDEFREQYGPARRAGGITANRGRGRWRPGPGSGRGREGARSKTVLTENTGQVEIDVPRDRGGTFEPQIVRKRNGVDRF